MDALLHSHFAPAYFMLAVFAPYLFPVAVFALANYVLRRTCTAWSRRQRIVLGATLTTALTLALQTFTLDGVLGITTGALLPNDTIWAPGYSSIGFSRVRPGMSLREVEALVGPPLDTYVAGGAPSLIGRRWSRSAHSSHYYLRVVIFRDGRVQEKYSEFYVD